MGLNLRLKRYRVTIGDRWSTVTGRDFWTLNGATDFYCKKKGFGADVFKWSRKFGWRWIFGTKAPQLYQFRNK